MEKTLGQKLRILRESRHFTQQQISGFLHLERAAYANYESDRRNPSYEYILVIADFYDVRVDYLIRPDFTGNPRQLPVRIEHMLRDYCRLAPDLQKLIADFIHHCAASK